MLKLKFIQYGGIIMRKTKKTIALFTALIGVMSASTINVMAASQPELEFGLTLGADGSKVYDTAEIAEGEELTLTATPNTFKKNGYNAFEAATLELKFDSSSEYCASLDDVKNFEFEIKRIVFNNDNNVTSDDVTYTLADADNGGFNINKSIDDSKAWITDNDELISVNTVEVTLKITKFESNKEKPSEEIPSDNNENSSTKEGSPEKEKNPLKNPDTGVASGALMAIIALAGGTIVVSKRK